MMQHCRSTQITHLDDFHETRKDGIPARRNHWQMWPHLRDGHRGRQLRRRLEIGRIRRRRRVVIVGRMFGFAAEESSRNEHNRLATSTIDVETYGGGQMPTADRAERPTRIVGGIGGRL